MLVDELGHNVMLEIKSLLFLEFTGIRLGPLVICSLGLEFQLGFVNRADGIKKF